MLNARITELEAVLILAGAIIPQLPPRQAEDRNRSDDSDIDNLDDDEPPTRKPAANARAQKNVRGKDGGDSDSDFEFDL